MLPSQRVNLDKTDDVKACVVHVSWDKREPAMSIGGQQDEFIAPDRGFKADSLFLKNPESAL